MLDPYEELGIDPEQVTDETVRQAYVNSIRMNPPDRDPAAFERIQTAYGWIKDEHSRLRLKLFGFESDQMVFDNLPDSNERPRVDAGKWLIAIEAEAKRQEGPNPYGK